MPSDYILPTGQNQGFNPTIYRNVGPGLVGYQAYAPINGFLRVDGSWATPAGYLSQSTAVQTPVAATRTYIAGTGLTFAAGQLQVGSRFVWKFDLTKTAAGTATSVIDIAVGTAGTTADTAQVSFTKPAGVAAADEGWVEIDAVVKAAGTTTGVLVGEITLVVNNTGGSGGHLASGKYAYVANVTSSTFNTATATNIGVCITTGAADAITIDIATGNGSNLAAVAVNS